MHCVVVNVVYSALLSDLEVGDNGPAIKTTPATPSGVSDTTAGTAGAGTAGAGGGGGKQLPASTGSSKDLGPTPSHSKGSRLERRVSIANKKPGTVMFFE